MIELKNIRLHFEDKVIFQNLNLSFLKGVHTSISAPSGKGKTTLLKLIQGYVLPDEGIVEVENKTLNANTTSEIRSQITWIPQDINLPVQSGKELIDLLQAENESKILEVLELLELEESILNKNFQEVSGGQKQRIVLAICLSFDSPVLLLDEPNSALDSEVSNKLLKWIDENKNDKTIVSVSHSKEWLSQSDQIVEL